MRELHEKNSMLIQHEEDIDELWQETLMQNILHHGLPEERGEDLKLKVTDLIHEKLKIDRKELEQIECFRFTKPGKWGKIIQVKFPNQTLKNRVYYAKKELKVEPQLITEDLTNKRNKLYQKCTQLKRDGKITAVWTTNCNIVVIHQGRKHMVCFEKDYHDLCKTIDSRSA